MTLRFGIIGLGNIGRVHLVNFLEGKISRGTLSAVCDVRPSQLALPPGLPYFSDVDQMIASGLVDAMIVAVPHPMHLEVGRKVLAGGLHLLMEKPLAATKRDAEELVAAPRRRDQLFGMMLNLRMHPKFRQIKALLDAGGLGELQRIQWTITDWFRPEVYFALGGWRATWRDDGGGVLLNQALHNLDMLQWLCGMPRRVRAFCQFGRDHDIEVEDSVAACFEYASGAIGLFATATGEAPGVNRLEIAGTGGLIVAEHDRVRFVRNRMDARLFSRSTNDAFGPPESVTEDLPVTGEYLAHSGVVMNFIEAALDGRPLLADAVEGLKSVELANAMVYSAWQDAVVELPLDGRAYQAALDERIAASQPRLRPTREAKVDMQKSFSI